MAHMDKEEAKRLLDTGIPLGSPVLISSFDVLAKMPDSCLLMWCRKYPERFKNTTPIVVGKWLTKRDGALRLVLKFPLNTFPGQHHDGDILKSDFYDKVQLDDLPEGAYYYNVYPEEVFIADNVD